MGARVSRLPVVSARELLAALRRAGFIEVVSEGGHRQLRWPEGGSRVTVPVHGGQDVPVGTRSVHGKWVKSVLRHTGPK